MTDGLDRSIALVDSVFRYAAGEVVIDECIEILSRAEARHGVELVTPGRNFEVVDEQIVIVDDPVYSRATDPDDATLERLIRDNLFPFLTDTHAVITPRWPDDSDIFFEGRRAFYHATARGYAETFAEWARGICWLGKRGWNYIDFYYAQSLPRDYDAWSDALREVVDEKTRRARSEPAAF